MISIYLNHCWQKQSNIEAILLWCVVSLKLLTLDSESIHALVEVALILGFIESLMG